MPGSLTAKCAPAQGSGKSGQNRSLAEVLRKKRLLFIRAGVESPELSAQLLLAESLKLPRDELLLELVLRPETVLSTETLAIFERLCRRRLQGEPAAYILGRKEFYGRTFLVNAATLIPRPETELLVDEALKLFKTCPTGIFADLGTGSGCLAITLALELPGWKGVGADISAEACRMAGLNAQKLGAPGLSGRLGIIRADFTRDFLQPESVHLLVSNPPYISDDEYAGLDAGVRSYEPKIALVPRSSSSKASGLEYLEIICKKAVYALKPGGVLLLEMGSRQGQAIRGFFQNGLGGARSVRIIRDLAGMDRVCAVKK
ncbi:MAG: peptide chain release factor N(5)-glutamine methyltransferase [Deltaproteobacteria bacterium]|jgi:release factor glutamine methyltransferase|nr:peptide chain release factor N(5)-glutamine methyltransferase [Deltaproteobacteria bacterium]